MFLSLLKRLEMLTNLQDLLPMVFPLIEYVQGSELAHAKESEVSDHEDEK